MLLRSPVGRSDAVKHDSIGDREWQLLRTLVHETTGIALGDGKRVMLASRLGRRIRALSLSSISEYCDYLRSAPATSAEWQQFINSVTTNKTDFYRESHHFDLLAQWVRSNSAPVAAARQRGLRVWSAACSTGEEPYTIAHTLRRALPSGAWERARILATDIDTDVLSRARIGQYSDERVVGLQGAQRSGLVAPVRGDPRLWQVERELQAAIRFERLNFLDDNWPIATDLDAIFCRNALIYFDSAQQRRIVERFVGMLAPHGLLFLGHAENLHWLTDRLEAVGHTAYRLRRGRISVEPSPASLHIRSGNAPRRDVATRTVAARGAGRRAVAPLPPQRGEGQRVDIGDVVVGRQQEWASAVLGSCVAVCLVDPVAEVGGINHVLLPGDEASVGSQYGTKSYEHLLERVCAAGARLGRLQAKLVGGAVASRLGASSQNVSKENLAQARAWLELHGIPLLAERSAGTCGVELHFQLGTGVLLVRPLPNAAVGPMQPRSRE